MKSVPKVSEMCLFTEGILFHFSNNALEDCLCVISCQIAKIANKISPSLHTRQLQSIQQQGQSSLCLNCNCAWRCWFDNLDDIYC